MGERTDSGLASTTEATAALSQSHIDLPSGTDVAPAPPAASTVAPDAGFEIGPGVERGARGGAYNRRASDPLYRPLWIYAIDPGASAHDGATALVNVPYEPLQPGPEGALFKVIARDPDTGLAYRALDAEAADVLIRDGRPPSPGDPQFHQQMVYAVCSCVYATFRRALGRQISWGFDRRCADDPLGTRLLLYPHGGPHDNAWYDRKQGSLRFGYSRASSEVAGRNVPGGFVFTCLSHDIVAHEVTHALLDGLRSHFSLPTSREVLGFHEGFADLVAILQHFSYPELLRSAIGRSHGALGQAALLTSLAQQFGHTTASRKPLRSAIEVDASGTLVPRKFDPEAEEHTLGGVLVSAVFDAFLTVFERKTRRYVRLASAGHGRLPEGELPEALQALLADEASQLASQFLSICIRAIDYCPPVDLELGEYLRALVTADYDLVPDDPWGYREAFIEAFSRHHIYPPHVRSLAEDELRWQPPPRAIAPCDELSFAHLQFCGDPGVAAGAEELRRQASAIGELVREQPDLFGMTAPGKRPNGELVRLPRVQSVRSCRRVGPDGQVVFDLVAEVTQRRWVPDATHPFDIYGGATVLIGPEGEIRYLIAKNILNEHRTQRQRAFMHGFMRNRELGLWQSTPDGRLQPNEELFRLVHEKAAR